MTHNHYYLGVRGVQRECYILISKLSTISILYVLLVNFKKSKIKHPSKQKNFCTIVTPKKKSNFILSQRYLFNIKLFLYFFFFYIIYNLYYLKSLQSKNVILLYDFINFMNFGDGQFWFYKIIVCNILVEPPLPLVIICNVLTLIYFTLLLLHFYLLITSYNRLISFTII